MMIGSCWCSYSPISDDENGISTIHIKNSRFDQEHPTVVSPDVLKEAVVSQPVKTDDPEAQDEAIKIGPEFQ